MGTEKFLGCARQKHFFMCDEQNIFKVELAIVDLFGK